MSKEQIAEQMREIKFRAWNQRFKRFHYLGYSLLGKETFSAPESPTDTYQQYTGLKDKNGVEIYEGDILTPVQSQHFNAVVGWHKFQGRWMTTESKPASYVVWGHKFQLCEVIGNIYENPELLEQSK